MATALTATTIVRPSKPVGGSQTYMGIYSCLFDDTDATGITTLDLTGDFKYVDAVFVGDNDTLADNGYKVQPICPARTTALTATNLAFSVHMSAGAAAVMGVVASADLSAIGAMKIVVYGRKAL